VSTEAEAAMAADMDGMQEQINTLRADATAFAETAKKFVAIVDAVERRVSVIEAALLNLRDAWRTEMEDE